VASLPGIISADHRRGFRNDPLTHPEKLRINAAGLENRMLHPHKSACMNLVRGVGCARSQCDAACVAARPRRRWARERRARCAAGGRGGRRQRRCRRRGIQAGRARGSRHPQGCAAQHQRGAAGRSLPVSAPTPTRSPDSPPTRVSGVGRHARRARVGRQDLETLDGLPSGRAPGPPNSLPGTGNHIPRPFLDI
jgi:hypothetical protein